MVKFQQYLTGFPHGVQSYFLATFLLLFRYFFATFCNFLQLDLSTPPAVSRRAGACRGLVALRRGLLRSCRCAEQAAELLHGAAR